MNNYSCRKCQGPEDCFARSPLVSGEEACRILIDTDFGSRSCPFYKSYAQYRKERALHGIEGKEKAE